MNLQKKYIKDGNLNDRASDYLKHLDYNVINKYLFLLLNIKNNVDLYFKLDRIKHYDYQLLIDHFKYIRNLIFRINADTSHNNFIDNNFKINKYIPFFDNVFFIENYELLYKMKLKKLGKNVIEISNEPSFFEVFTYFQNYFNLYEDTNFEVFYPVKDYQKKNSLENKYKKFNYLSNINFLNSKNNLELQKYDFMFLKIFKYNYFAKKQNLIISETFFNILNFYLQFEYLKYLKNKGSCLFYIHTLNTPESIQLFIILSKMFKNITIYGRKDTDLIKYMGGVFLYCQNKGSYNINIQNIIKRLKKWNLTEEYKKYIYNLDFYKYILNNKKYNLKEIKIKQIKKSYEWAKKYNFAILPIYDPIIPQSFYKNFDQYFNINQSEIKCKINLLSNKNYLKNIIQKINFQNNVLNRLESIYKSLLQSILSKKSYVFSPISLNTSNLVYYIEKNYKIPFINNSWLQYFELFYSASLSTFLFKNKNLISLHINELPGFSISPLFYYLQIFHKNIHLDWKVICKNCVENDIFGYYKKYKSHFSSKLSNKSKFNLINIEYKQNMKNKDLINIIKNHLIVKGNSIIHFYFEKIEDLTDNFYQTIYEFSSHFKNIQLFRSQWALTKNSFFVFGIQKLRKSKKINFDNLKNHIQQCLFNIFNQYQFEIEKYYFIYQNEKTFKNKNIKLIENNMIQRNKKWCHKMKLNNIKSFF